MITFLYIIWFGVPVFFFILGLWALMEKWGGSPKKQNPADFFKQGVFVLAGTLICVVIDQYFLESLASSVLMDILPLPILQIALFPAVLLIGALIIGPTKPLLVSRGAAQAKGLKHKKK